MLAYIILFLILALSGDLQRGTKVLRTTSARCLQLLTRLCNDQRAIALVTVHALCVGAPPADEDQLVEDAPLAVLHLVVVHCMAATNGPVRVTLSTSPDLCRCSCVAARLCWCLVKKWYK